MAQRVFFTFRDITRHMQHYCRNVISCAKCLYFMFKKHSSNGQSSDDGCFRKLPNEIMETIVQHLSLSDRIRLSVVSKSWRSVIMDSSSILPWKTHEFPWLVLPQSQDFKNDKTLSFYGLSYGKVVDLELPKPIQGAWFFGSSKGWLIMIKEKGLNSQMFLLNPISRVFHQLPPLATISCFHELVQEVDWNPFDSIFNFEQVSLSTEDISSSNQCVVATWLFGHGKELWLCRPNENSWNIFHPFDNDDEISNLCFIGNKLYVRMSRSSNNNKDMVVARTLIFEDQTIELLMVYVGAISTILGTLPEDVGEAKIYNDHNVYLQIGFATFLLESTENELLLIVAVDDEFTNIDHNLEDVEIDYLRKSYFWVFKIETNKADGTSCYTRVSNLGDQMLFVAVDGGSCFSLSSTDSCAGYEKNCIYFALPGTKEVVIGNLHTSREIGKFDLNSEKITRSFPSVNISTRSRLCWYVPRL